MADISEAYNLLLNESNCVPRRDCKFNPVEPKSEGQWSSDAIVNNTNNYGCNMSQSSNNNIKSL